MQVGLDRHALSAAAEVQSGQDAVKRPQASQQGGRSSIPPAPLSPHSPGTAGTAGCAPATAERSVCGIHGRSRAEHTTHQS